MHFNKTINKVTVCVIWTKADTPIFVLRVLYFIKISSWMEAIGPASHLMPGLDISRISNKPKNPKLNIIE